MKFSKEVQESPTLSLAEIARKRKQAGKKVISFAVGEPDFKTPEFIIKATIKALKEGYTGYSTPQGLIELRIAIKEDYKKRYNANYSEEEIIVFPGAKPAIYASLASLLEKDDEVIIISPYYVSYPPLIKLAEVESKIIEIPLRKDFKLPIDKIKAAITKQTKLLILNYPNNPTGQLLTKQEVKELVQIIKEKEIYLLADEIYDQLIFEGETFVSFSGFKEIKDQLIIINGFSKAYAMTGFRIGYALANKDLVKKMNLFNQNTNTNTNTFVQRGCLAIYENDKGHLATYLKQLQKKVNYLDKQIKTIPYLTGIKPRSTFYYFVDISKTQQGSQTFSKYLIERHGIVATPGKAFGKKWDNYLRLSLALPLEEIKEAVKILKTMELKKTIK